MVLVSHRYNFIYIKNKKVAGSSVESFFGKYCCDPSSNYLYTDKIDESINTSLEGMDPWLKDKINKTD